MKETKKIDKLSAFCSFLNLDYSLKFNFNCCIAIGTRHRQPQLFLQKVPIKPPLTQLLLTMKQYQMMLDLINRLPLPHTPQRTHIILKHANIGTLLQATATMKLLLMIPNGVRPREDLEAYLALYRIATGGDLAN